MDENNLAFVWDSLENLGIDPEGVDFRLHLTKTGEIELVGTVRSIGSKIIWNLEHRKFIDL